MRSKPTDRTGSSTVEVDARLHEAWVRRLRWHFDHFNEEYLGGCLRPPLFRIGRSRERLGEWSAEDRTITVSEHHVLAHRWESVLDTLRHEMAHQYVHEILGLGHAPPHAEPFQRACRLLRCDPAPRASAGGLERLEGSDEKRDRILGRIKELLALADSPNEHEAAAAMRMAHRYLLEYNLDLVQLEGRPQYGVRHLGRPAGRVQEYQYTLSSILQEHFFVLSIWTFSYDPLRDRPGRVLQISGTPENLEMAAYVHDYVMALSERLWDERRRSGGSRQGTKFQYLAGLLRGFREKLHREQRHLREERGLVWLGDPELKEYFCQLHPRTRSVSVGGVARSPQYRDGVRDGRSITIRRGVEEGRRARGRQLPGPPG